ncbi:hypothetical protein HispidOSU_009355, partial [Sigmodon hispidus]
FDTLATLPWATKSVYMVFQKEKDLREQHGPSPVEESPLPPQPLKETSQILLSATLI